MSGYIFTLFSRMIYWNNFKQHTVADSICKAKYITTSNAAKKAVWLRKFIDELGVISLVKGSVLLYCDSIGAIAQAKKPKSHQRTKHILHRYHLVREIIN